MAIQSIHEQLLAQLLSVHVTPGNDLQPPSHTRATREHTVAGVVSEMDPSNVLRGVPLKHVWGLPAPSLSCPCPGGSQNCLAKLKKRLYALDRAPKQAMVPRFDINYKTQVFSFILLINQLG